MRHVERIKKLIRKLPSTLKEQIKKYDIVHDLEALIEIFDEIFEIHTKDIEIEGLRAHAVECPACLLASYLNQFHNLILKIEDECLKAEFQESFLTYKRDHLQLDLNPEELEFLKPPEPTKPEVYLKLAEKTDNPDIRDFFLRMAGQKKPEATPEEQAKLKDWQQKFDTKLMDWKQQLDTDMNKL